MDHIRVKSTFFEEKLKNIKSPWEETCSWNFQIKMSNAILYSFLKIHFMPCRKVSSSNKLLVSFVSDCEVRESSCYLCCSLTLQQQGLLLNTEQLVCPWECNRIWERPASLYHSCSAWPANWSSIHHSNKYQGVYWKYKKLLSGLQLTV